MVVCLRVHAYIHAYMYTSIRECLRMLSASVFVCVRMNICVYTIHIYAFRLYSAAVFHGSYTFILRSTDGYLDLCGITCDTNCTLCFQHLVLHCSIVSVVAPEQATVHITPLLRADSHSILAIVATSDSLLLVTIQET